MSPEAHVLTFVALCTTIGALAGGTLWGLLFGLIGAFITRFVR